MVDHYHTPSVFGSYSLLHQLHCVLSPINLGLVHIACYTRSDALHFMLTQELLSSVFLKISFFYFVICGGLLEFWYGITKVKSHIAWFTLSFRVYILSFTTCFQSSLYEVEPRALGLLARRSANLRFAPPCACGFDLEFILRYENNFI